MGVYGETTGGDTGAQGMELPAMETGGFDESRMDLSFETDVDVTVDMMTEDMEEAYNDAMVMLEDMMAAASVDDGPSLTIDGVGLTSSTSPVATAAATSATTVSIISNSADGALAEEVMRTVEGHPPVILSTLKFPILTTESILEAIKLNQVERQLIKETIISGLETISSLDTDGLYTALVEEDSLEKIRISGMIEALSSLQTQANIAASGLDLHVMSEQIMSMANTKTTEIMQPTEASNSALPSTISSFLESTFEDDHLENNAYTNSAKLIILAQNLFNYSMNCYPTVLSKHCRSSYTGGMHAAPLPTKYGTDLSSDTAAMPTCHKIFQKNAFSIVSRFVTNHFGTPSARSATAFQSDPYRNLLDDVTSPTPTESWDYINHLICLISNELITSAGIGRLKGGSLGERFIISSPASSVTAGSTQLWTKTLPYDKVLGADITVNFDEKFWVSGGTYPGGFLDYLALGEEAVDEAFVVMPFEVNTAKTETSTLVSGKKYFIDMGLQSIGESQPDRSSLKTFATQFSSFTSDMSVYMTELMALDQETSLAPELILARVLQDFKSVLAGLSLAANARDPQSDAVAGLFQRAAEESSERQTAVSNDKSLSYKDLARGCTLKAIKSLDAALEDSSFKLSEGKTSYITKSSYSEEALLEISAETEWFESTLRNSLAHFTGGEIGGPVDTNDPMNMAQMLTAESFPVSETAQSADPSHLIVASIESFDFHDGTWTSSTNLLNLISKTIRELQSEAAKLAARDGAESDYRSDTGETLLSGADDDRFITVMVDLYTKIASLILPMGSYAMSPAIPTTDSYGYDMGGQLLSIVDGTAVNASLVIVSKLIDSLTNGAAIDGSIYEQTGLAEITELNQHNDSSGHYPIISNAQATVQDIVEAAARIQSHRYNIKATLKIIETVAAAALESSASLTNIFNILDGNVENLEDLTDIELVLHEMFQSQSGTNAPVSTAISEQQNNLNCAAYQTIIQQVDEEPIFFRSETYLSKAERAALNVYTSTIYNDSGGMDDLYIVSVGLPSGLIEAVTRPAYHINPSDSELTNDINVLSDQAFNDLSSTASSSSSMLRFIIDRCEEVYFSMEENIEVKPDVQPGLDVDPELFILPNSIQFDPNDTTLLESGRAPLENFTGIFDTTTFYRIRGGMIIEALKGETLGHSHSSSSAARNCLKSYLLDLFMYETAKIRYNDTASVQGKQKLTDAGYNFISNISSNTQMCMAIGAKKNFVNLFSPKTKKIVSAPALRKMLTSSTVGVPPEHTAGDLFTAGYLGLVPMLTNNDSIVRNRKFERVYNFIYDDGLIKNSLLYGDTDPSIRNQFDAFSMVVTIERLARIVDSTEEPPKE